METKSQEEQIPNTMNKLSMGGKVWVSFFQNRRMMNKPTIQKIVSKNFTKEKFDNLLERIRDGERDVNGNTDTWLRSVFEKYPITGKDILVEGGNTPWYELMAVVYGAKIVTVLADVYRDSHNEHIVYKNVQEVENGDEKFDVIISVSQIEHFGLERRADFLEPDADLERMKKYGELLKEDGILFLSVPVGIDKVFVELQRVYGEIRLKELLRGWEVLDTFGMFADCLLTTYNTESKADFQPVFVLRKRRQN